MLRDFDPRDPVTMFNALTPTGFQLDICRAVHAQYARTVEHCFAELLDPEARGLAAYYRRASIESSLVDCLAKYDGFNVIAEKNVLKNWSHRTIVSDHILITHSSASNRKELPRKALFRKGYARSGQMYLFEDDCPPVPDPSMYLYAIITHCPSQAIRTPEFIDIVFPDENYEKVVDVIPLLEKFPQVGQVEAEVVKDDLKLRKAEVRLKQRRHA